MGENISSSSCDTSLYEGIPPTTIPTSPPTPAPPMTVLTAPELPVAAPPTLPPWSVHLPSYPPRVICRFCFQDSHEVKNRKCWACWKKSDRNKAIAALDEAKMKNPTALHFTRSKCCCKLCYCKLWQYLKRCISPVNNTVPTSRLAVFFLFYNVFQPTKEHPPSSLRWDKGS
jgi:hypothetical protein